MELPETLNALAKWFEKADIGAVALASHFFQRPAVARIFYLK